MRRSRNAVVLGATLLMLALGALAASALAATSLTQASKGACCKFAESKLTAKPGKITIKFTNRSGGQVPHNFSIKGSGHTKTIKKGSATLTVTLKKGTYRFLCTVPTHAANGMKGTLVVG